MQKRQLEIVTIASIKSAWAKIDSQTDWDHGLPGKDPGRHKIPCVNISMAVIRGHFYMMFILRHTKSVFLCKTFFDLCQLILFTT